MITPDEIRKLSSFDVNQVEEIIDKYISDYHSYDKDDKIVCDIPDDVIRKNISCILTNEAVLKLLRKQYTKWDVSLEMKEEFDYRGDKWTKAYFCFTSKDGCWRNIFRR